MKKIIIGIIGLGIGLKHIDAFNSHPHCEVIAICDFSTKKLNTAKAQYPDISITENSDEIINNPLIDLISIASYDNYHFGQIIGSIQKGKHVFVEKPLCLHIDEAIKIRDALNEKPAIQISSNLNLRTCPLFTSLKSMITTGGMGEIYSVEGDYLWGRLHKLTDGWRKDMEFYSVIHGAAVHMIDLLMWLLEMKPVEVFGYGNRIASRGSKLKYNDFATILMKFENSMVAKISANSGCVHPHFHVVSVFGTKKTFFHSSAAANLIERKNDNLKTEKIIEDYPAAEEKKNIILSFLDSILDPDLKPIVSQQDVFDTMSVCFAAEKALQTRAPEIVQYI